MLIDEALAALANGHALADGQLLAIGAHGGVPDSGRLPILKVIKSAIDIGLSRSVLI